MAAATGAHYSGSSLSCHYQSSRGSTNLRPRCILSMNGCGSGSDKAVGICQTRTLPAVTVPESAVSELKLAVAALDEDPPSSQSGIIRLEVPIQERADAIDWLHAQQNLPRCFFSGRGQMTDMNIFLGNGSSIYSQKKPNLVNVAGMGSAVFFQRFDPFELQDWKCIKRFLSKDSPLIRAYGGIRFDARTIVSPDWKAFGSFYFIIPQVEFDELEESSILATTIAWDGELLWPWEKAIDSVHAAIQKISPYFNKVRKTVPSTTIISCSHVPTKTSWDVSVKKSLKMINRRNSDLVKVVLARCSNIVTDTDIDPLTMLACLQTEGQNAYQFYIQPPDAPAFIGNTPEQLFHRNYLNISSEALAGTRARGRSKIEDVQIGQDLLFSAKDDTEFTIVRESIRRKMEIICSQVLVDPSKALRKLPRVQHLSAQLLGRLRNEDDEFDLLASLHPSPAVCGLPTEEARQFIKENEMFDRGMYAGPVGWFGGSGSEFAVGIRSALVGKGFSTLVYAGAGIVKGTNPTSEWEELDLKASQFTKLLQSQEQHTYFQGIKNMDPVNKAG